MRGGGKKIEKRGLVCMFALEFNPFYAFSGIEAVQLIQFVRSSVGVHPALTPDIDDPDLAPFEEEIGPEFGMGRKDQPLFYGTCTTEDDPVIMRINKADIVRL